MGKNRNDFTGKQYRGGRVKGRKNLEYTPDGNIVNAQGVTFTEDEKKKLESLVNSANRKRKRMLQEEGALPRMLGGVDKGDTIGETMQKMGKESDFILAKKSKSLNKFRNKKEYDRYVANLEKVVKRDYVEKRVEQYKENHIKGLKNVFGKDAEPIIKELEKMKPKEYMKKVQSDELLEINYIYDPQQRKVKLERLKSALLEGGSDVKTRR